MNIEIKNEKNYAAQVIRVPELTKAENSDRLYIINVAGNTVVVNDSWQERVGQLAVMFPAESQISEGLAHHANLFRHADRNRIETEQGYLEDNRRVRALKLRGNVSNGLILPILEVADYIGYSVPPADFQEGLIFDTVDGKELCRKYVIKTTEPVNRVQKKLAKAFKRVDERLFPVHVDTDNYLRNEHMLHDDDQFIVTQKLHGSSVRLANVPVKIQHKWYEKLASKLGVRIPEWEFATIAGSRKVTKDPGSTTQNHYYGSDIWTLALEQWKGAIPKNVIVYGELVGFTPEGGAIQKGFTYEAEPNEMDLYVYRVSVINEDGVLYDLSWDQVRGFCDARDMNYTPELWRGPKKDFPLEEFKERSFRKDYDTYSIGTDTVSDRPVALSKSGTGKDEGIVIRVDRTGEIPLLFKYKNDSFLLHETAELDTGEEGIEA